MTVLFLTVTGQPEANLESAHFFFQQKSSISKIVLLSTTFVETQGKTVLLQSSLAQMTNIPIEVLNIPNGYEDDNIHQLQNLVLSWIDHNTNYEKCYFNVTGGTKLISIALDNISKKLGISRAECFYQNREHEIVWYNRLNNQIAFKMQSHLNIKQRVNSRGYEITRYSAIADIPVSDLNYANIFIDVLTKDFNLGSRFCSFINKIANQADEAKVLKLERIVMDDESAEGLEILASITDQYYFSFDPKTKTIHFKNQQSIDFMKGGWLEVYTGWCFVTALQRLQVNNLELVINIELKKNGTPNEMDVMFIYNGLLFCVECKTAKTMKDNSAKDVLYKLSSLAEIGGLKQKNALVTLYPIQHYNKLRAENSNIKVFQKSQLINLQEHVYQWLKSISV